MVYYTDGRQEPMLDRAGLRALAELMSDAFMEHDNWKRVLPEAARRKRALYALFSFMASVINRYGHIVVSVDGGRPVGYTTFMENADRRAGIVLPHSPLRRVGQRPWFSDGPR
jgi:hypothetical protein